MKKIIGSKYFDNLMRIKGLVRDLISGGYQETQRVFVLSSEGGGCYYDDCFDKKMRSDKRVTIINDGQRRVEAYSIHSQCLKSLLKDERVPGVN